MKCSICGARLKKEGDICTNCYKEYKQDEELKKDVKEVLKLKRKYSINYEIARYSAMIIIFILMAILYLLTKCFAEFFITIILLGAILGFLMFLDKRIANGTKVTFYEKKVKYKFKFLFINKTKVIKYKDIKDITYYQSYKQKKFGYGDICVYTKEVIPGAGFFNGFQIKNVENIVEALEKIKEIVGTLDN